MEKTLQQQYNLIKEGKASKDDFLKSARRVFPEFITSLTDYNTAVHILKGKSVLSEGVGGIVTQNPTQPDWFKIFDKNLKSLNEDVKIGDIIKHKSTGAEFKVTKISGKNIEGKYTKVGDLEGKVKIGDVNKTNKNLIGKTYEIISEAVGVKDKEEYGDQNTFKASKETEETLKKANYDNKDPKNIDNLYGQSFLMGYYTEMRDPKNSEKTVDELKAIVAKNMAKDVNYYHTEASFGVKGIGYKKDVVGGGEPKAPKGKYKSSGYGDLDKKTVKEGLETRSISSKIKPSKNEFEIGDIVVYKGAKHKVTRISDDGRIYIKSIKFEGRPEVWVKSQDLRKAKTNESVETTQLRSVIREIIKEELDSI